MVITFCSRLCISYQEHKRIRLHCNQNWFCMGGSCPHFIFFTCINTCIFDIAWKTGSGNMNILKKNSTCNNSEANSNNIRCDRLDVDYHKTLQKPNVFTQSLSLKCLSWRKLSLREELILCNYFWRGDKWETHYRLFLAPWKPGICWWEKQILLSR